MDNIEQEFKKIFGDMYLSESETALRIFEYGYKAGLERACKLAEHYGEQIDSKWEGGAGAAMAQCLREATGVKND